MRGHGRKDRARTICVLLELVVAEAHPECIDDTGRCPHHPERELFHLGRSPGMGTLSSKGCGSAVELLLLSEAGLRARVRGRPAASTTVGSASVSAVSLVTA